MTSTSLPREAPWQAGLHSARTLVGPGLLLQAVALGVVLSYYYLPAAHDWFGQLAHWRTKGGYAFSALASALCGGLLPFIYLRYSAADRADYPWAHVLFFSLFWAWKGAEVDLLYRTLSRIYGDEASVGTIIRKVATDQFGFNVFYAAPVGNLLFAWKNVGFHWTPVMEDVRKGQWYVRRVLPVLISIWALWIPVVSCVYAMPSALQIPLFNVVLCFWSLLFAHLTARQQRETL